MLIPQGNGSAEHCLMDNKAVRKRNIQWLVEQYDGPTNLGKILERDQVQVSQWLGGKPVGDKLAQHIAEKLGEPKGWLDIPHWDTNLRPEMSALLASQPTRPDFVKISGAVKVVQLYLEFRGEAPELVADPVLLAAAYEVVHEGGVVIDESNVIDAARKFLRRREAGKDHGTNKGTIEGAGRDDGPAR